MNFIIDWHKNFSEKKRKLYKLNHYQVYWISWFKGLIFGLLISLLISCSNKNDDSGWTYLFDGKSTYGWRAYNGTEIPNKWTAQDGNLTFETKFRTQEDWTGGNDIIYYLDEFDNFELSLEWKLPEGGNSGVFYHLKEGYSAPYLVAPEYQIIDDFGWGKKNNAELEDWQKTGADYAMYSADEQTKELNPPGQWNKTKIKYTENKVEHWLNDKLILSYVPYSEEWYKRKNSGRVNYPDYGKYKKGYIGLQDHDSQIWFRNIKIKKL